MQPSLIPHIPPPSLFIISFFFNDTATTEIYTLSLHDALPIFFDGFNNNSNNWTVADTKRASAKIENGFYYLTARSEEHTSELQSHVNLVCRLLLEKKKH